MIASSFAVKNNLEKDNIRRRSDEDARKGQANAKTVESKEFRENVKYT